MSTTRIVLIVLFQLVSILLALVGVPIAALFARWDDKPTTFTGGAPNNGPPTIRGDLPRWAAWFGTFDERLPGGMYEPTVATVYRRFGRYWCSVYWLVVRNRMFGLTKALFGKPIPVDADPAGMTWFEVGPFRVGYGTKKYRATPQAHWLDGPFVEIAVVSARFRR